MKRLFTQALIASACIFNLIGCEVEETPAKKLPSFDYIQSNGSVKFKLVTGVVDNRVISTNIAESMYNVSGNTLQVNAAGGSMTIAVKDLNLLWCNACSVENTEPLVADTLSMSVHAGSVDLQDIHINGYLGLNAQNLGTYKFSGYSHFFTVSSINLVSIEAFNLVTDSTYVNSTSVVDTEVNATQVVNVFINSSGSVRYRGNPPIVRLTKTGSGRLIKDN
jgi:hypothetical protein